MHSFDPSDVRLRLDDHQLRRALAGANLPTLQLVMTLFEGDVTWLSGDYAPTRSRGAGDHDQSGLAATVRAPLLDRAFTILREWRDGERDLPEPPDDKTLVTWMGLSLGEEVPAEYGATLAEQIGFKRAFDIPWPSGEAPPEASRLRILVVGAGLAGIATSAMLTSLGLRHDIIERGAEIGGVWRDNHYPGAGVDTPSHLYSYSFAPSREWSRYYAKQPEILSYIAEVADELGVGQRVKLRTELVRASWDEAAKCWRVTLDEQGQEVGAAYDVIITAVGFLNQPVVPSFPGMDTFEGPMFHSARWNHDVDIREKRVAVVGTGASAMQIVPTIADSVASVTVFQRSPQWVIPNENYLKFLPESARILMRLVPYYAGFYRARLMWLFQDKLLDSLRKDAAWEHPERAVSKRNDRHRESLTQYVDSELGDRQDLRAGVLPTYPPYGKRPLMDNGWMRALRKPNVHLVEDAVTGFDRTGVVTNSGEHHEADVVVLATGFHTSRMLWPMDIVGKDGRSIREAWGVDDPRAYLSVAVPKFPNLFLVGGPNSGLGHGGSILYNIECAIAYIGRLLVSMAGNGYASLEVREEVSDAYNAQLDAEHDKLIWTHEQVRTWYKNTTGRVTGIIPWRGVDFWAMTQEPDLDDYLVEPAPDRT
ncbi:NAD(P)/FAD-dependent oxidoreductase [Amycolatopsis sp. GM8]|uniref:flavin-containing monooxygenase n=1 Tax=Amycolatopsis sp. GM8 TaxID=2896530 RepID=UPI001F4839D9|nr:NAD(P)/FAD-dependent oxidoreductase [Amycolatopsis sp. GM8]